MKFWRSGMAAPRWTRRMSTPDGVLVFVILSVQCDVFQSHQGAGGGCATTFR